MTAARSHEFRVNTCVIITTTTIVVVAVINPLKHKKVNITLEQAMKAQTGVQT
jgi:hypothetical protein